MVDERAAAVEGGPAGRAGGGPVLLDGRPAAAEVRLTALGEGAEVLVKQVGAAELVVLGAKRPDELVCRSPRTTLNSISLRFLYESPEPFRI